MTTYSDASVLNTTTDAGWRQAGLDFANLLTQAGMVQTADTGQINWATVLKPTSGDQNRGYEIWRLNDTQQATAPIFLKFEYRSYLGGSYAGTGSTLWIVVSVGTGSDGAGTLTGILIAPLYLCHPNNAANADNSYFQSYACGAQGATWVVFKYGANQSNAFYLARWTDSAGDVTADGITLYADSRTNAAFTAYMSACDASFYYAVAGQCAYIPGGYTENIAGQEQIFPHFAITPTAIAQVCALTVKSGLITAGIALTATPAGSTERTYIAVQNALGYGAQNTGNICLIWE